MTSAELEQRAAEDAPPFRRGGPTMCPSPCSECTSDHHFSDAMVDFAEELPEHEAAVAGIVAWFTCKHCEAWEEWHDGEDEFDDEEVTEG